MFLATVSTVGIADLRWHPHPDVWATVAILLGGYLFLVSRHGTGRSGPRPVLPRQVALYVSGVLLLWLVSDWPFHDIGETYLFTFHMLEHLVISLAVPPLLLLGTPRWLADLLLPDRVLAVVRWLSKPIIALPMFNLLLAAIHWPPVVERMVGDEVVHLLIHTALFVTAFLMWIPMASPTPRLPQLGRGAKTLYAVANTFLPTIPASFLTFSKTPLYQVYVDAPRLWAIDPLTDQTIAGLIMKLGGGFFWWGIIAVIWFRWYAAERRWDEIERRLRDDVPVA